MERDIITINEEMCNGCGECRSGCPEGAIQIIDGKARLVSDLFCDGLGACIGECPTGALRIERRKAEPFSEERAIANVARGGANVIKAHLQHLQAHGEQGFLKTAVRWLENNGIPVPVYKKIKPRGYPGQTDPPPDENSGKKSGIGLESEERASALRNWPIQLALNNPDASRFNNAEILLAADCVAFAYNNLQGNFLSGKMLIIFCPKLDDRIASYREKLVRLLLNGVKSVTVLRMVVPCCGIDLLLEQAMKEAGTAVPVTVKTISLEGEILPD